MRYIYLLRNKDRIGDSNTEEEGRLFHLFTYVQIAF